MRDLFVDWAKAAGCTVEIDRLGNIFARRAGSDPSLPPVAIGSHLDTQICGGRYDGILGVLCGLEVVRTLNDRGLATKRGIEVICWTNEEGARFSAADDGLDGLRRRAALDSVLATTDDDGITVEQALDAIGYAGPAPLGQRAFDAYLELHIEQAPVLDREKAATSASWSAATRRRRCGSPSRATPAMPAARRWRCGATRWSARAMSSRAVNDIGLAYAADEGRTTTTRIESFPNLPGTYAEEVKLTHRLPPHRSPRASRRCAATIDAAIAAAGEEGQCRDRGRGRLELGHRAVRARMHRAAEVRPPKELGLPYREMRSQAGHDAYAVATMAPTAMIFTPCFEGISHNVNEAIELVRSVPGANLLLNAAVARANR